VPRRPVPSLAALALLTVPVLGAAAVVIPVLTVPRRPGPGPYQALVVPGARVLPDGAPSPALRRRVDGAVALWRQGVAPRIVVTGRGRGPASEAAVGARLAREAGVPDGAILLEETAHRTAANASRTAALLGRRTPILVVTERWHGARARLWFRRAFDHADVIGVPCPPGPTLRGAVREAPKLLWRALEGRRKTG
jgi:uncharacterized SAM-binding protein YcdF (DUF218 family)